MCCTPTITCWARRRRRRGGGRSAPARTPARPRPVRPPTAASSAVGCRGCRRAANVMTGAESVLIEDWCQQFPSHSIGSLAFGADGALYVTGGDGASFDYVDYGQTGNPVNPCGDPPGGVGATLTPPTAEGGALRAQDLRTTAGDPVGLDGVADARRSRHRRGVAGQPAGVERRSQRPADRGLRLPQPVPLRGAAGHDEVWIGDVGWATWEEIDRVTNPTGGVAQLRLALLRGRRPPARLRQRQSRPCARTSTRRRARSRRRSSPTTMGRRLCRGETCPTGSSSVSGLAFAFYSSGPYPPEYDGALFFADYSRNCIWAMEQGGTSLPNPSSIKTFVAGAASPVDLQVSPERRALLRRPQRRHHPPNPVHRHGEPARRRRASATSGQRRRAAHRELRRRPPRAILMRATR